MKAVLGTLSASALAAATLGATAVPPVELPEVACESTAYGIDTDPRGSHIRKGPGTDQAILLTAPPNRFDSPRYLDVRIAGSTGEWLSVRDVTYWDLVQSPDAKPVFKGPGWMHASLLGTGARGYDKGYVTLYAMPSYRAHAVGRVPSFKPLVLAGCAGQWLKVTHGQLTGWINNADHCPNPLTTCP